MPAPRVVLVEPRNPANVGFIARLLANFGLDDWVLAGPPLPPGSEAERTGAPARKTLAALRSAPDLPAALGGATHALGFTARPGRHRPAIPLAGLGALKKEWGPEARVALVFGREDRGLEAAEAERLHALATIPARGLSSFNLSHAVALALWEWFRDEPAPPRDVPPRAASPGPAGRDPRARASAAPPAPLRWSTAAGRARLADKALAELLAAGFHRHPGQLESCLRRLSALPLEARDLAMLERIVRHARWRREGGGTGEEEGAKPAPPV